jgi:hypothetical protein
VPVLTINLANKEQPLVKRYGRAVSKYFAALEERKNPFKWRQIEVWEPTVSDDTHGLSMAARWAVERAPPLYAVEESYCSSNPDHWTEDQEHVYMMNGYEYLPYHVEAAYKYHMRRMCAFVRSRKPRQMTALDKIETEI